MILRLNARTSLNRTSHRPVRATRCPFASHSAAYFQVLTIRQEKCRPIVGLSILHVAGFVREKHHLHALNCSSFSIRLIEQRNRASSSNANSINSSRRNVISKLDSIVYRHTSYRAPIGNYRVYSAEKSSASNSKRQVSSLNFDA